MSETIPILWIFANGEIPSLDCLADLIDPGAVVYAADGGLRHLARLGRMPSHLIGDLDSVAPEDVENLARAGVVIEKYPQEKDETDLELAILRGISEGFSRIRIAGSLGGRLDQTLGNLALLQLPQLAHADVRLEDGLEEVFLIRESAQVIGKCGETVSLLPVNGPALGVVTCGLKYPLHGETLTPEHTRGISNVLLGEQADVRLSGGALLCVHRRMSD